MRINQTYRLLWLLAMQLVVFSCDVVPYKDAHDQIAPIDTGSQDTLVGQNILIEDFTGHYCGNCPLAAIEAKRLEEKYGSRIVVMGIHCTYFAKPKDPNGIFGNDYRTPAGDALESKFNVGSAGLPKGLINRSRFGKTSVDIQI